jgi:quinohemoprotein ethanol dehydrogenase
MSSAMDVGWKYGAQSRRMLTFALDGKATLPAGDPRDMKVHALDDPKLVLNEKDVLMGRGLSLACVSCHGAGFRSSGAPGPDLRESGVALDFPSFKQVVKEGRMQNGMPAFQWMTDEQIRQVWTYIRARSREALGVRKTATQGQAAAPSTLAPGKGPVTY